MTLGGMRLRRHGFSVSRQENDVLALAPGSSDWRTSVQSSSNRYRNGRKRKSVGEKTTRFWPLAELSARAKFTRECVVKQFWTSFVGDKCDLDSAIQKKTELS